MVNNTPCDFESSKPVSGGAWICAQIGARDHYAVPRALARGGNLRMLITDAWCPPRSMLAKLPWTGSLAHRWDADLAECRVLAPQLASLPFEAWARLRRLTEWKRIRARNEWFQKWAVQALEHEASSGRLNGVTTCFSYSYGAGRIFEWCKKRGIQCVLGQVDPGPSEWQIISELRRKYPDWCEEKSGAPDAEYWDSWERELAIADAVMINSRWSEEMVRPFARPPSGLSVIPLACEIKPQVEIESKPRGSGMRVLYLGQVCLRKGIQELVEASQILQQLPIHVDVVGAHGELPLGLPENMTFHGRVPRPDVASWYRRSDVFVLPTHSDGFALTQLEAMSHSLPVVTTRNCAHLVEDKHNGILIPAGDPRALANALKMLFEKPELRNHMGEAARETSRQYSMTALGRDLLALGSTGAQNEM